MIKSATTTRPAERPIRAPFETAVGSVRLILDDSGCDTPRKLRKAISEVVGAYEAMSVVKDALHNFRESGVQQWRTFLRAANVKNGEAINDYRRRVASNLDKMQRFSGRLPGP